VKRILASATTPEDVAFHLAYARSAELEPLVLCTNFIAWTVAKRAGLDARMPPRLTKLSSAQTEGPSGFSTVSGRLTAAQSIDAQNAAYAQANSIDSIFEYALIPSGRHAHQLGLQRFCRERGIPMAFLGYGNIKGMTVVDPWGTDAASQFFQSPNKALAMLGAPSLGLKLPNSLVAPVLEKVRTAIESRDRPVQARGATYPVARTLAFAVDTALQWATGRISDRRLNFGLEKIETGETPRGEFVMSNISRPYEQFDHRQGVLFFPFQVSTDVQLLENYVGGSLEAAILEVDKLAVERGKTVCFKRHPVEPEYDPKLPSPLAAEWLEWGGNTNEAFRVFQNFVVVNSTVGLQALIFDRSVEFIGKTMFSHLKTESDLAIYFKDYVMEFDFQNPHTINQSVVRDIEQRLEIWSNHNVWE
jgi:capsular polysaccharide export protein